jgi:hypothetical protein
MSSGDLKFTWSESGEKAAERGVAYIGEVGGVYL